MTVYSTPRGAATALTACRRLSAMGRLELQLAPLLLNSNKRRRLSLNSTVNAVIDSTDRENKTQNLPRQGVPPLAQTVAQFLRFSSILQPESDFQETIQIAREFLENKQTLALQRKLENRSKTLSNWLTPWWLDYAYLMSRTPLPIVTSPGVTFPKFNFTGLQGQLECAAKLIQAVLKYHHNILDGKLKEDKAGGVPLDMSQYQLIYGTTRIPKHGKDEIRYGKDGGKWAQHIIVVRNGHSFHVPVYDTTGFPLSVAQLQSQLQKIIAESESVNAFPINICSSDERDKWAQVYDRVKNNNRQSIISVENALFVVALDRTDGRSSPSTADNMAQAIHGGGSGQNTINRWFDKTLQLYVNINGSAGLTYEHTPAEGPPLAMLLDFVCDQFDQEAFHTTSNTAAFDSPSKLNFQLTNDDRNAIIEASNKIDKAAANLEIVSLGFDHYGKNVPKAAGLSPDSFIQLAMQLAYYKLHNSFACTYETGTLRKFAEGRTDTIRLPNEDSAEFVQMASSRRPDLSKLAKYLREAVHEHKDYSKTVMNGNGIDRHLLGLKILAKLEEPNSSLRLLSSPAYNRLLQFQLSTSQVPTRHVLPMGYGPAEVDGYGCCYNPQETRIFFSITAFKSSSISSALRFSKELQNSLHLMRDIIDQTSMGKAKPKL
ncbi:choline/Carnitine o-acyltransferase domain-containing protein [Ditylenchus destructor]|nr:choline/Carnitine o-acyltransferase domain-containing protein [Ditylenchus destructor]